MLKEIAAKKVNALMAGYGYLHAGARPSSKPLMAYHDTGVRLTHAHSDHPLAVIPDLMQDEAFQAPAQRR